MRGPTRACSRGSGACRTRARGQGASGNDLVRHRGAEILSWPGPRGMSYSTVRATTVATLIMVVHSNQPFNRADRHVKPIDKLVTHGLDFEAVNDLDAVLRTMHAPSLALGCCSATVSRWTFTRREL